MPYWQGPLPQTAIPVATWWTGATLTAYPSTSTATTTTNAPWSYIVGAASASSAGWCNQPIGAINTVNSNYLIVPGASVAVITPSTGQHSIQPATMQSHDAYLLDCMYSCAELPADLLSAARRMGSQIAVAMAPPRVQLSGAVADWRAAQEARRSMIREAVLGWIAVAPVFERVRMAYSALFETDQQIEEITKHAANLLIQAHLCTQDIAPPLRQLALPDEFDARYPDSAVLTEDAVIEQALAVSHIATWRTGMAEQFQRLCAYLGEMSFDAFVHAYREDAAPTRSCPPRPTAGQRRRLRDGRKALRRSIALFCKFRNEREIKTFLRGDELHIEGVRYIYRVRKRGDVLSLTMRPGAGAPYHLDILSKAGATLASGCVYMRDTPVIDQLLFLALHVCDREEELRLIRTTNWSRPTEAFYDDATLLDLTGRRRPPRQDDFGRRTFLESGNKWLRRLNALQPIVMPRVRAVLRRHVGTKLPVWQFMERPSFRWTDLLDGPQQAVVHRYGTTVETLQRIVAA